MHRLVLARWSEQKTSIWSKSQPPEERCKRLVGIKVGILDPQSVESIEGVDTG